MLDQSYRKRRNFVFSALGRFAVISILTIIVSLLSTACGIGEKNSNPVAPVHNQWVWMSGAPLGGWPGVYGTQNTPSLTNVPGAREAAVSWIDSSGNLWLFGGVFYDFALDTSYDFNDLWKFDGVNWTWVSGADSVDQGGTYGAQRVSSPDNVPGARDGAVSWIDKNGALWLFGGSGYDSAGDGGDLNDLWKFDGANWIWVSGAQTINQAGIYEQKDPTTDPPCVPGAREYAVSWMDQSGNLWLFGGGGFDAVGTGGYLNDLWKFDGVNWTWVNGDSLVDQPGTYVSHGSPGIPGARNGAVSWIDNDGNLWLFGGVNKDGELNDLWKFDVGTLTWTWMSGSGSINQPGSYTGIQVPGARDSAVAWIDKSGTLWLFGGYGYDSTGEIGDLNDLWKFDGAHWTWMSGNNIIDQQGYYSNQNITAPTNVPGARLGACAWIDQSGFFWLFGGYGYDANGLQADNLNDLWVYQP